MGSKKKFTPAERQAWHNEMSKKGTDLIPTTSTIHLFDYQKVFRFIFKNKKTKKGKEISHKNDRLGKGFK